MARIFLSHASEDKPIVRRIAAALESKGHVPWLDEAEIVIGDSIPAEVERALRECDFVVFCMSRTGAERGWVEAERHATFMEQMKDRKTRILPVRLEDVKPPFLLAQYAYVDLFPDDAAFNRAIGALLKAIEKHERNRATASTGAPPNAAVPPPAPPPPPPPAPITLTPSPPTTVDVFVSFAPEDASFVAELEKSVVLLTRQNHLRILHRNKALIGQDKNALIDAQLQIARVILILVSKAYIADEACYQYELEPAVKRHQQGTARVVPILIRPYAEWTETAIGTLMPLPRSGLAVEKWRHPDEAWAEIATELRSLVFGILGLPLKSR